MYIVRVETPAGFRYFSGIYYLGIYTAELSFDKIYATKLSAEQADTIGAYYYRHYHYSYVLERV